MASPTGPSEEIDLRPFNDRKVLTKDRNFILGAALACFVLATVTGPVPLVLTAEGVKGAFGHAGQGTVLPVSGALALFGALFVVISFGRGTELAASARVDDSGLVFLYPSGRMHSFRWDDANLRLRLVDYVALPGGLYPGQRRIEVYRPFVGRTNIPAEFLARIIDRARSQGVDVANRRGPAGRGTLIELSRTASP